MLEYEQVRTAVLVVLAAVATFTLLVNGLKAWKELRRPTSDLRELVDQHDEKLLNDHERLADLKESDEKQAMLLLQIANHLIDGNHMADMIRARDDMQSYLITRK